MRFIVLSENSDEIYFFIFVEICFFVGSALAQPTTNDGGLPSATIMAPPEKAEIMMDSVEIVVRAQSSADADLVSIRARVEQLGGGVVQDWFELCGNAQPCRVHATTTRFNTPLPEVADYQIKIQACQTNERCIESTRQINRLDEAVKIDPDIRPIITTGTNTATIGGLPISAIASPEGARAAFITNELLILGSEQTIVEAFLDSHRGRVERVFKPGDEASAIYRVVIDVAAIDPSRFAAGLSRISTLPSRPLRVSDYKGLSLLAAAIEAREAGLIASPNFVLLPSAFPFDSFEAPIPHPASPNGPPMHQPNVYNYSYMGSTGALNIGVEGAWNSLRATGRDANRVKIAIFDAGFVNPRVNGDYPSNTVPIGSGFNVPNPWGCGGGGGVAACPWHGTQMANAAFGVPSNGSGAAGPAGPVAEALLVHSPAQTFGDIFSYILDTIPRALRQDPHIMSMSGSAVLPSELHFLGEVADFLWRHVNQSYPGLLAFGAAGNGVVNPAGATVSLNLDSGVFAIPCEIRDVVCVGGLNTTMPVLQAPSNFGSGVDIFAPWDVWVGPDNTRPNPPGPATAQTSTGTSPATAFTAGVAALIYAADPNLDRTGVRRILTTSANIGSSDTRVGRWVNADEAVVAALDARPAAPPLPAPCTAPRSFRITINGFSVMQQTSDDAFEGGGNDDEIFIVVDVFRVSPTGAITSMPRIISAEHGDAEGRPGRIPAGSGSSTGGLATGDVLPMPDPADRTASGRLITTTSVPLLAFTGTLQPEESLVIIPTIWEWDQSGPAGDRFEIVGSGWGPRLSSSSTLIAAGTRLLAGRPEPTIIVPGSQLGLAAAVSVRTGTFGTAGARVRNRPVGLEDRNPVSGVYEFEPKVFVGTCGQWSTTGIGGGSAMNNAGALLSGVYEVDYIDHDDIGGGSYRLFLQSGSTPYSTSSVRSTAGQPRSV